MDLDLNIGLKQRCITIADDADEEKGKEYQAGNDCAQPQKSKSSFGPVSFGEALVDDVDGLGTAVGRFVIHIAHDTCALPAKR